MKLQAKTTHCEDVFTLPRFSLSRQFLSFCPQNVPITVVLTTGFSQCTYQWFQQNHTHSQ